jgi:hypothetical protein
LKYFEVGKDMQNDLSSIFEDERKEYLVLKAVYDLSKPEQLIGISEEQVSKYTQLSLYEVEAILERLECVDGLIVHPTYNSGFISTAKTKQKIKEYEKLEIRELLDEFTSIANDLIEMNSVDDMSYLKRFMKFIESEPYIFKFIQKNQVKPFDIMDVIQQRSRIAEKYEIPDNKSEEIAFTYQLLKYGLENFKVYYQFTTQLPAYGNRSEGVLKFNQTIVRSFCNRISSYLQSILNKLGDRNMSSVTQNFHGSVGAVQTGDYNVANVTQNNHLSPNLVDAAREIQQLLEQLTQSYPTNTQAEKLVVVTKTVEQIENNPSLKERTVSALKGAGVEGFKELIDNPLVNILVAAIEGWKECK